MLGWHIQTDLMQQLSTSGKAVILQLCVDSKIRVNHVWVRTEPDNEELLTEMKVVNTGLQWTTYETEVALNCDRLQTPYAFKVEVGDDHLSAGPESVCYWLSAYGWKKRLPGIEQHFKILDKSKPPVWVQDQIFYQIFPDRFCDGNPSLSVKTNEYLYANRYHVIAKSWEEPGNPANGSCEFYGGDLPGVIQKLDYLKELGVTAIYLNPIFESPSNHKYDCTNYLQVDPHLGSNETLAKLRKATSAKGLKLMLDAVINHTSDQHCWMTEALAGNPEYRSRYIFDESNGNYQGWKDHPTLPVLDYANTAVVDYCYAASDSVVKHWLKAPYCIDGWRLDVIHMLGEGKGASNNLQHIAAIRGAIKSLNSEAFMVGEHFSEATQWLQGEHHDGAVNYYGFLQPLWGFLANTDINYRPTRLDASDFADWLTEARSKIPFSLQKSQLNLLDSHDTKRLFTLLKEDVLLMKLAIGLQFTYIGVPCIYYGDENGVTGGDDPDCRKPMCWQEKLWNTEVRDFYRTMITIRKQHLALRRGDLIDLFARGNLYIFCRLVGNEQIVVAVNRGKEVRLEDASVHRWLSHSNWLPLLEHPPIDLKAGLILRDYSISVWWNGCCRDNN